NSHENTQVSRVIVPEPEKDEVGFQKHGVPIHNIVQNHVSPIAPNCRWSEAPFASLRVDDKRVEDVVNLYHVVRHEFEMVGQIPVAKQAERVYGRHVGVEAPL